MSTRRSSRLQNKAAPTLVNPISNYGSVKRRLNFTDDNSHAKKLARVDLPAMESQMDNIEEPETPKVRPTAIVAPISAKITPMANQDRGNVTPTKTPVTPSFSSRPPAFAGDTTPKSCRRRLFNDGVTLDTPKTDLYFSTFNLKRTEETSNPPTPTTSTIAKRNPEQGNYAGLSRIVKDSLDYPLPAKFQRLYDHFEMMDRVMSIGVYKSKRMTFESLAKLVQRKTLKDFPISSFAQIMGVYPSAYNLRMEENRETKNIKLQSAKKYTMYLETNLKGDLESYWTPPSPLKMPVETRVLGSPVKLVSMSPRKKVADFIPVSPRKTPIKATPQMRECRLDHSERLEPWRMACRRAILRYKLYLLVAREHDVFLNRIKADGADIPHGQFHEKFNLDSVPDVTPAKLPEPPKQKPITDFLTPVKAPKTPEKADFVLPKAVNSTLAAFKSPEKPTHSSNGTPLSPRKFAGDTPKLSLYERIMEKQRLRDEKLAPARQAAINRRKHLQLLRDSVFYSVWTVFSRLYPKTTTLKLNDVVYRVSQDVKTLSGPDCIDVIDLLCEVAPRHFDVFTAGVHSCRYMRVTLQDLRTDYTKIQQLISTEYDRVNAS